MGSDTLLQPNQAKVVDPATGKYSEVLLSVALPNVVNGDVFSYCNLQKDRKGSMNLQYHYFSRDSLFYFLGGLLYTVRG